jgi:hypothetical protein
MFLVSTVALRVFMSWSNVVGSFASQMSLVVCGCAANYNLTEWLDFIIELFGNFSFRTNSGKKQQNAMHFAKTCSITNGVSEQVQ